MSLNLIVRSKRLRRDAGIALLTAILMLLLMSSLLVGFSVLLYTDIQLSGASNDQVRAFYGAEAGMEQMTANLGNLFSKNYSPSIGQINAISAAPPVLQGIQFLKGDDSSGYSITPQSLDANGNPAATISTIKSGAYQGMTAMATEYTLMVNARTITAKKLLCAAPPKRSVFRCSSSVSSATWTAAFSPAPPSILAAACTPTAISGWPGAQP